jgi:pimeloyl-ACP methyl ester carboxylesterase
MVRSMPGDFSLPTFVLVHGLASNARLWDGVAEGLMAADHSSHAVDLRGHGESEKPDTGYDFATVASDVAAVVRDVAERRAILVGQSWGANVVMETAARFPEVARAVVCIDGGYIKLADSFPDREAAVLH